ncbi:MAG: protein translocase subunit SecF [Actinobacteria bacterium]|nr:protein translocase subunit SecF [Actinomycetota bacterium]MCL5072604.1 protein translocase subunit SecF [Actinomycetota bacterium]
MAKKKKIAAKIAAKNIAKTRDEEAALPKEKSYRFDFLGKSKFVIIISTVFIITGIIFFFVRGFNFGIDFRGGNLMEVQFKKTITISQLRGTMEEIGYGKAILQSTASDRYIIRTVQLTDEEKTKILNDLDKKIGIIKPLIQDRNVAPGFSQTIIKNALIAVAISVAGILIYVWIRFAVRFALVAILELFHDLLIILSFYLISYREFNSTTIAVILTILGYSLSDCVVIFDRIREELKFGKTERFPDLVNYSINKTIVRSLITGTTTFFPIIVLLIVGNETLKDFGFGLLVGIISGTFSSIFIGPPVLAAWNKRFPVYKK